MRYCIGDVHGCYKTLNKLVELILKNDKQAIFYFVGDLIDRGPNSKGVLDFIMNLHAEGKAFSVKGNHEAMLLNSYKNKLKLNESNWQYNGAEITLKNFSSDSILEHSTDILIPEVYFKFIDSLPYYIELKDFLIVHAGFNFKKACPLNDYESMLWTREEKYNSEISKGKKIIHGHIPISLQSIKNNIAKKDSNIINIDSGCVYINHEFMGNLSAFNMDNNKIISIRNVDIT